MARRPSVLGLSLTGCLLIGLLLWRSAVPAPSAWLDAGLLAGVGALLVAVRDYLQR